MIFSIIGQLPLTLKIYLKQSPKSFQNANCSPKFTKYFLNFKVAKFYQIWSNWQYVKWANYLQPTVEQLLDSQNFDQAILQMVYY